MEQLLIALRQGSGLTTLFRRRRAEETLAIGKQGNVNDDGKHHEYAHRTVS